VKLYHRTSSEAASAIVSSGFRDGWAGGVELSSVPYPDDQLPMSKRGVLLAIAIPDDVVQAWEWRIEARTPDVPEGLERYWEFLLPAAVANRYGPPQVVAEG
jgi:hypothetical protein